MKSKPTAPHSAANLTDSTLQQGKVQASSDPELRRQAEVKLIERQKKGAPPPTTEADTRRLVHELEVHQIELEMQNEELVQSRAQVETGLRQYIELYDFAPVGYFTLARDGAINQVNLTGANLLGVERSALIKRRFGVFVSVESRSVFNGFLEKMFESGQKKACDVALQKDGAVPFWVHIEATCSEDAQECRTVAMDITEHKRAEEKLRKSEERFRNLFDNALEGVYQSTPEGRLISANMAFSRMFGYETPEEIIKSVTDIGRQMYANPDDRKRAIAIFQERGYIEHFECPMRQKDGSIFWALFSGRVAKTPDGITCLEGFISDISSLKRSEDLLRLKNLVFDTSLAANSIADLAGVITEANDAFLLIWGYSKKDEVVGNPIGHFLNDPEEAVAIITALNGKGEWQGDFTAKKKDGSTFIAHSMATVIRDENGKVTGYQSSVVDITERKQAEEALKESEQMLVQTAEIGKVGGWTFDIETRKQTWTKMVYDIHEVDITTYQPTVDKGISFYTPASRPIIERAVQCAIEQGEPFDLELEIITARGNLRNIHAIGRADQACRKVVGFFQDVTAHKRVEEALRESEERFRLMFQNSAISMAFVSPDFYFLQANDALCKMMGYTATELLEKTFQDLTMPEDRQAGGDLVRRVLSGGMKAFELEKRYQRKDGAVIFGKVNATLIRDAMNNPLHFIVHIQDITSRKQAEEEILKLNTNLEQRIKERTAELNATINQLEETNRVFVGRELKMMELKERIAELETKT